MLFSGMAVFLFTYLLYANQTPVFRTRIILVVSHPTGASPGGVVRDLAPWSESHGDPFQIAERELLSAGTLKDALVSLGEISESSPEERITIRIASLAKLLSMNIDRRQSQIELIAMGPYADSLPVYANAVARAFISRRALDQKLNADRLLEILRGKLAEHGKRWEEAEARLVAYRAVHFKSGIPHDFESQSRLRSELTVNAGKLKEEIDGLESQMKDDTGVSTVEIGLLERELTVLVEKRAALAERFTNLHPEVEMVSEEIQQMVLKIESRRAGLLADREERFTAMIEERKARLAELEKRLDEMDSAMTSLPDDQAALLDLERDRDLEKGLFEMFSAQAAQQEMMATTRIEETSLAGEADRAEKIYPKEELQYSLALSMAIVSGLAAGFLWEMLDNSIKSIDEVEEALGAPVIGVVPNLVFTPVIEENTVRMPGEPSPTDASAILLYQPRHQVSEAYRSIATSLEFTFLGEGKRSLLFTSALPGEGKTATASNTAIALAHGGKRVLLIDGNLRKPGITNVYNLQDNAGVIEVMDGRLDISTCIYPTSVDNLFVMPAGTPEENPADILRQSFASVIGPATENYDAVIVDSPPVLPVADTNILASMVDGCVIVYLAGKTPNEVVSQTKAKLLTAKCEIAGVVLNRIKREGELGNYYYSYYYTDYSKKKKNRAEL